MPKARVPKEGAAERVAGALWAKAARWAQEGSVALRNKNASAGEHRMQIAYAFLAVSVSGTLLRGTFGVKYVGH